MPSFEAPPQQERDTAPSRIPLPDSVPEQIPKIPFTIKKTAHGDFDLAITCPDLYTLRAYDHATEVILADDLDPLRSYKFSAPDASLTAHLLIPEYEGVDEGILQGLVRQIQEYVNAKSILEDLHHDAAVLKTWEQEEATYDARKKAFFEQLLKYQEGGDLPLPVNALPYGTSLIYLLKPNDVTSETIGEALTKASWSHQTNHPETPIDFEISVDTHEHLDFSRIYGGHFALEPLILKNAGRLDAKEMEGINDQIRAAFAAYLKSGKGRNRIKLELKRMDPDYKTRAEREQG